MQRNLQRLTLLLLIGFAVTGALLGYWGVVRAPALASREDNPRTILAERRIQRGRILDRNGHVLAETVGEPGAFTRHYPYPQAAPAIGYYSLRYGLLGVEAAYDATLRGTSGDFWRAQWDAWLQRPPQGRDVRLTLDLATQRAADAALGERHGAVVLLSLPDGAIRALASHPTYDPNRLDETFEALRTDPGAPLLNRATQGLYQPGAVLETVVLAAALEQGVIALDDPAPKAIQPLELSGGRLFCARIPDNASAPQGEGSSYLAAYIHACPSPFAELGPRLGIDRLRETWARFGLDQAPSLPIPTTAGVVGQPPADGEALRLAAAGQGELIVTPLHMALVAATIAEEGYRPQPYLVEAVQAESAEGSAWQPAAPRRARPVLTPAVAQALAGAMRRAVTDGAAQAANTPNGVVAGHAGVALAGPGRYHAWFIGFAPANAPRYAIAVLIEDSASAAQAAQVGSKVLRTAFD
jgi:peptidoglycan glycosyltransferase